MVRHVVMGKPSNPNISFLPLLGLTLTLALLLCRDEILVNPLKGCGTAGGVEAPPSTHLAPGATQVQSGPFLPLLAIHVRRLGIPQVSIDIWVALQGGWLLSSIVGWSRAIY